MDYFKQLLDLLKIEKDADFQQYRQAIETQPVAVRRENGLTWFPIAIRGTEMSKGDYLIVELERTTHLDINHQFRFGVPAVLFSNHNAKEDRIEGIVSYQSGSKLKLTLRTDDLPDWASDGKLGIDISFDNNTYDEMRNALQLASQRLSSSKGDRVVEMLTGIRKPQFNNDVIFSPVNILNASQNEAVKKIMQAQDLAIVHGPPGTGKTTTLVQAIQLLLQYEKGPVLVVAPSNTAVDLLTEKLAAQQLNVVRIGNPVRVSERLMSLTLDAKVTAHTALKDVKKMKKQAAAFRDMAHKYKRNFGKAEREQRNALFTEARKIMQEVASIEQYVVDDLLTKAQVITATLAGANHYTVRNLKYHCVVIDEAGQALEPASWIPVLKGGKIILAGDHLQLPPTIKSDEAARAGLTLTLIEKLVALHPEAVVMLNEQYRMNELIMGYPSKVFYKNELHAAAFVAKRTLFEGDHPLAFVDTAGCGFDEKQEGVGIVNAEEAALLFKHLYHLVDELKEHYTVDDFPSVAIISPYNLQVQLLKQKMTDAVDLHPYATKITVNTIDSFQGQERDIVYISMTRSNSDGIIGFLSDIRRMNVAMTRAKKKLVVIGDSATLSRLAFYADFIQYAEDNNAYISAWELMDL